MITYRELPATEWDKLQPIFDEHRGTMPSPQAAKIFVAESRDRIIGFTVLQAVNHLEPVWIDEKSREAPFCLSTLVHMAESRIPPGGEYYCFTSDAHVSKLAEAFGLRPQPYSVYAKEV